MPRVSVIMPVYNMADMPVLKAAVDSIKNQTLKDWELIICDDASTDQTLRAVLKAAGEDTRIKILRSWKNRGAGYARNACIRVSTGSYLALMDADDISHPKRLERQLHFLEQHPEYAFVGCNVKMIDHQGVWGERRLEAKPTKESFLCTLPFVHPSVMIRKEVMEEMHGYAQTRQMQRTEDYDLLMRVYARGYKGYNLQEILYAYREDAKSYRKRKYGYRMDECRVRYMRFRDMGILQGNFRYVLKPLIVGMIPGYFMRMIKKRRFGTKQLLKRKNKKCSSGGLRKSMSEIKIFVTHTPNRKEIMVENPLFYHVAGGSDFQTEALTEGLLADHTGENISCKNKAYCELTTQYWAWKNVDADYYGFCHYRRYFSFAPEKMPRADCGCLIYPYLNQKTQEILCMDEKKIRQRVENYDFLIAEGIPVRSLWAKTVYEHYKKASGLNSEDLELFLRILVKKYPFLRTAAQDYMNGKVFYPCNMFLMRKELFVKYSQMLFKVLEEFERQSDTSVYSREGYRTPGHLGERFAGIFFEYLKRKGGYRLGELQMALIEHTEAEAQICIRTQEIPVVLSADQQYVPILFTCLKSLTDCTEIRRNYHIYILHTDICTEDMQVIQRELTRSHIQIDFVDAGYWTADLQLKAKEHITKETFYRFLIPDLFKDCQKVIYLDSDLIIRRDIAQLYDLPLGESLLAAALDADFIGQYNGANPDTKYYCDKILKLKNPYAYLQAGVLVFNIEKFRQRIHVHELFRMAEHRDYRYSDQDILNIVCAGRIKQLDMAWNVQMDSKHGRYDIIRCAPAVILEEYEQARKNPFIIHYSGDSKPWKNPREDFAKEFWQIARKTPYYEELLYGMGSQEIGNTLSGKIVVAVKQTAKKLLPQGSRIRLAAGRLYWMCK